MSEFDLELHFQEKARLNRQAGGRCKGLSKGICWETRNEILFFLYVKVATSGPCSITNCSRMKPSPEQLFPWTDSSFSSQCLHRIDPRRLPRRNEAGQGRHN
jgi:hypothetical protein